MPIYGTSIGLSASTIGLILGSFAAATFIVRLALPWLSRRMREWTMITATFGVACVAYALFPLVEHGAAARVRSRSCWAWASAPRSPRSCRSCTRRRRQGRAGEAVGVRSVVLNASHTVLPLLFGGVGAALGMTPVFWTMAGLLAAGGVFANRRRRARAPGSASCRTAQCAKCFC